MECVFIDAAGYVRLVDPQPAEISGCSMVIVSGDSILNNPFALTTEQGTEIGVAIGVLWTVALVCRLFVRQITYSR